MIFKKGMKVELLTLKVAPSGLWRLAEIIGINSHNCTVRYEGDVELFGKETVERVSRKVIRPCPPPNPVDLLQDWVVGDIVEVLHNFSWKKASILKVSGRDHVLVRLFGSAVEFRANKYDVRARLCWQDGEWIVIGKAANKCEYLRCRIPSPRNDNNQQLKVVAFVSGRTKVDNGFTKNTDIIPESQSVKSKTVKRKRSQVQSQVEAYARPTQKKIRLGKRESLRKQFNSMHGSHLPEKVENIASSREVMHEKRMHRSLVNKINGHSEIIMAREKTAVGYSHSVRLESNDDVSVSSSVASCSVYRNSSYRLRHDFTPVQYDDNDSHSSDAESCCQLSPTEGNSFLPANEVVIDEIHRLELHAYRCTIGALYELGPLSWEKELLLTNLRDSLHISNDEHLAEIRNLVSSSICIPTI